MNLNEWMGTFQSPMDLAKTAHKQIADQHIEIQALEAVIERFMTLDIHDRDIRDELWIVQHDTPAKSLNIIKADFLDWIRREIVLSDDVDNIADWMLGKAFCLRQEAEENDDERTL